MTFRYLLPPYMLFAHRTEITKPRRPAGERNEVTACDGVGNPGFPYFAFLRRKSFGREFVTMDAVSVNMYTVLWCVYQLEGSVKVALS